MTIRESVNSKLQKFVDSGGKEFSKFTFEETREVAKMIAIGMLNKDAFIQIRAFQSEPGFEPKMGMHPFTAKGEEERSLGWYSRFRRNRTVAVVRDILTAVAFLASLYLAAVKILN
jgi:hypothetical protein